MLHVQTVELRFLGDLQLVAAMDLRPAGQAGADVIGAVLVPFGQQVVLVPEGRARTNALSASKDIPQLGQLVQTGLAQRPTRVIYCSGS